MFLEIFIYLVIAFGTLVLCITMFEKDGCIEERYVVIKRDDVKIKVTVETEGLDEEDRKRLGWIIRKGKYDDICDIAKEFNVLDKQELNT